MQTVMMMMMVVVVMKNRDALPAGGHSAELISLLPQHT